MTLTRASTRPALGATLLLGTAMLLGGCQTFKSLLPWDTTSDDEPTLHLDQESPDLLYSNGIDALRKQSYSTAVKHFDAIQQDYPYSPWATNAQLMDGYTEYRRNQYTEAVAQLDRFIQLHPSNKDVAYAYYLRALCYYEQIADISRDQKGTEEAQTALQEVVNRFPDSAYARDARLKIDLCRDHLAGKEMAIGRYYEKQHLYAAAIGPVSARGGRFPDHEPYARGVGAADGSVSEARASGRGEAHGVGALLQLSGQPLVSGYSWNELVQVKAVQGESSLANTPGHPGFFSRAWGWVF